jgi:hypothetical protein
MSKRSIARAGTRQRRKLSDFRVQRDSDVRIDQDDWDLLAAYGRPWSEEARRAADVHHVAAERGPDDQQPGDDHVQSTRASLWPLQQAMQEELDARPRLQASWPARASADAGSRIESLGAPAAPTLSAPDARLVAAVDWVMTLQTEPVAFARALQLNPLEAEAERRLRQLHCAPPKPTPRWSRVTPAQSLEVVRWRQAWTLAMLTVPLWVRPLCAWRGDSRASLLRHLLVEHEPQALLWNWLTDDDQAGLQTVLLPLVWFVCQAQAISLRRVAQALGWQLPPSSIEAVQAVDMDLLDRMHRAHFLWDDHWDVQPNAFLGDPAVSRRPVTTPLVMLAATVRLVGAEDRAAMWLYATDCFDPAELPAAQGFTAEAARWLARHADELPLEPAADSEEEEQDRNEDVRCILRWAIHQHLEGVRRGGSPFTWRGRTARSALHAARDYERFVLGVYEGRHATWEPHGWNQELADDDPAGPPWTFEELLSTEQLVEEGAAQRHCVRGYAARCVMGESAIVTLLHGKLRAATIEVHPRTRRVVQLRGKHNARVPPQVQAIVSTWARAVGLECAADCA